MSTDTKLNKPWRNWCFTWAQPTTTEIEYLKTLSKEQCKYLIFGMEKFADGRDHLQGYIELVKTQRLVGLKKILDPSNGKLSIVHCEPSGGDRKVNIAYCSKGLQSHDEWAKLGTSGLNYGKDANVTIIAHSEYNAGKGKRSDWSDLYERISEEPNFETILAEYPEYAIKYSTGIQKAIDTVVQQACKANLYNEISGLKLYSWEHELLSQIDERPDPRKIIWYVDETGGAGKSTFAKYLLAQGDCTYFTNAKSADIAHAYKGEKTAIFDFTRSVEGRINYEVIESIKNGIIFASKYNSGLKINATPHVVCFSNFYPETNKLSQDRWDIRPLTPEDKKYPIPDKTTVPTEPLTDAELVTSLDPIASDIETPSPSETTSHPTDPTDPSDHPMPSAQECMGSLPSGSTPSPAARFTIPNVILNDGNTGDKPLAVVFQDNIADDDSEPYEADWKANYELAQSDDEEPLDI